ncbi:MAG: FixH family protein [Anaerolineae bacterium]|nr:FixH family protein [Anaerolineae bacterium]
MSLALLIGSFMFRIFIWQPIAPAQAAGITRRLALLTWWAWVLAGVAGGLLLINQIALATSTPLFSAVSQETLLNVVYFTRFGELWLLRMGLWLAIGLLLWLTPIVRVLEGVVLVGLAGLPAFNSLTSHAAGAYDELPGIVNDWLHLLATCLWVGGLAAFLLILPAVRRAAPTTQLTGRLVAQFSNFARVAVIALALTGFYSGWLQVGSPQALLTTLYGQTLLIKLLLFLPVLALAAVNLLVTQQRLKTGDSVWNGRLQRLVGAEVALTLLILLAVGVMTSVSPARNTLSLRSSLPILPDATPLEVAQTLDTGSATLTLNPAWAGDNTLTLALRDAAGAALTTSAPVTMQLQGPRDTDAPITLTLEPAGDGVYVGRATLARPGQWTLALRVDDGTGTARVDFTPTVKARPALIIPMALPDNSMALPERTPVLLGGGLVLLASGLFFLMQQQRRVFGLAGIIAMGQVMVALLLFSAAASPADVSYLPVRNTEFIVRNEWALPLRASDRDLAVYLLLDNGTATPERLLRASSEAAETVSLHRSEVSPQGVTSMYPVDFVDAPAYVETFLAPATYHLMLEGLRPDLKTGDTISITLEFESGKVLTAQVRLTRLPG